jgi:threonine/homoserine/homoserine lactone efflux protein
LRETPRVAGRMNVSRRIRVLINRVIGGAFVYLGARLALAMH